MALRYTKPDFQQPQDFSGIPRSIDQLFASYNQGRQRVMQEGLQGQQMQANNLSMLASKAQLAGQGINPNMDIESQLGPLLQAHLEKRGAAKKQADLENEKTQAEINKLKAEASANGKGGKPISPHERAQLESHILDKYMAHKTVSDFAQMKNALRDISRIQNNESGAADITAIYRFITLMDPNAVKEGEINLAQSVVPGMDRFKLAIDKFRSGKISTNEMKKDILKVAKDMYGDRQRGVKEIQDIYRRQANQYQINPEIAAPDFSIPQTELDQMGGPTIAPGTVQDGYKFNGGDPASPGSWVKL